jgi:hypothetical protein
MLHTPSKQSTLPRGAAAQRCIRQVNNQQYSVVQRRDAAYAFVFLLLVLLAPRNVCLSLACPSRSMEIFTFASLSLSLSLSLAYLCLYAFPSLSLWFLSLLGELLSVRFSPLLVLLAQRKIRILPVFLHSCLTLLLVLLAPNFYLMH